MFLDKGREKKDIPEYWKDYAGNDDC